MNRYFCIKNYSSIDIRIHIDIGNVSDIMVNDIGNRHSVSRSNLELVCLHFT